MLNVQTAETLKSIITLLLAYFASVTIAGSFRAWVADKSGDSTAADLGFTSLNPLMHIDFFGIIMLLFYGFGWGKFVPINPLNFHGKHSRLKLAAAFLSDTFMHLVLATIALVTLVILLGPSGAIPAAGGDVSSVTLAIASIVQAIVFLNIMLAVVSFIVSTCGMAVMVFMERNPEYAMYTELVMLLFPLLILFLFAGPLSMFVIWLVSTMGTLLAALFHIS
jgi:hypothetical protein